MSEIFDFDNNAYSPQHVGIGEFTFSPKNKPTLSSLDETINDLAKCINEIPQGKKGSFNSKKIEKLTNFAHQLHTYITQKAPEKGEIVDKTLVELTTLYTTMQSLEEDTFSLAELTKLGATLLKLQKNTASISPLFSHLQTIFLEGIESQTAASPSDQFLLEKCQSFARDLGHEYALLKTPSKENPYTFLNSQVPKVIKQLETVEYLKKEEDDFKYEDIIKFGKILTELPPGLLECDSQLKERKESFAKLINTLELEDTPANEAYLKECVDCAESLGYEYEIVENQANKLVIRPLFYGSLSAIQAEFPENVSLTFKNLPRLGNLLNSLSTELLKTNEEVKKYRERFLESVKRAIGTEQQAILNDPRLGSLLISAEELDPSLTTDTLLKEFLSKTSESIQQEFPKINRNFSIEELKKLGELLAKLPTPLIQRGFIQLDPFLRTIREHFFEETERIQFSKGQKAEQNTLVQLAKKCGVNYISINKQDGTTIYSQLMTIETVLKQFPKEKEFPLSKIYELGNLLQVFPLSSENQSLFLELKNTFFKELERAVLFTTPSAKLLQACATIANKLDPILAKKLAILDNIPKNHNTLCTQSNFGSLKPGSTIRTLFQRLPVESWFIHFSEKHSSWIISVKETDTKLGSYPLNDDEMQKLANGDLEFQSKDAVTVETLLKGHFYKNSTKEAITKTLQEKEFHDWIVWTDTQGQVSLSISKDDGIETLAIPNANTNKPDCDWKILHFIVDMIETEKLRFGREKI